MREILKRRMLVMYVFNQSISNFIMCPVFRALLSTMEVVEERGKSQHGACSKGIFDLEGKMDVP